LRKRNLTGVLLPLCIPNAFRLNPQTRQHCGDIHVRAPEFECALLSLDLSAIVDNNDHTLSGLRVLDVDDIPIAGRDCSPDLGFLTIRDLSGIRPGCIREAAEKNNAYCVER
jgi:hypothetical protein